MTGPRATTRWVLHVDMDQFIAAVEILRRPELRGRPVVVGGDGDPTKRGVVSTASYEARARGVHSGLPLRTAAKRLPDGVFLAVDRDVYEAASAVVMATLREFGVVEVLGWDEALVAPATDLGDDPESLARSIHDRVLATTGLHCSVGIGHNVVQAKTATGYAKPAGVFRLTADTWFETVGDLGPQALWGIGSRTAAKLADLGLTTVRALAAADPAALAARFGPSTGPWLVRLAEGRGSSAVSDAPWVPRSRSRETTFQEDLQSWGDVRAEVSRLARHVADDLAQEPRPVVRVVVKVRFVPFDTRTHGAAVDVTAELEPQSQRQEPDQDQDQDAQDQDQDRAEAQPQGRSPDRASRLERAALTALDAFDDRRAVRLVGVRAELAPPEKT